MNANRVGKHFGLFRPKFQRGQIVLRLLIYSLILIAFWLGLPQFHYSAAIMIAIIIRHKDNPNALLEPIDSADISFKNVFRRDNQD